MVDPQDLSLGILCMIIGREAPPAPRVRVHSCSIERPHEAVGAVDSSVLGAPRTADDAEERGRVERPPQGPAHRLSEQEASNSESKGFCVLVGICMRFVQNLGGWLDSVTLRDLSRFENGVLRGGLKPSTLA